MTCTFENTQDATLTIVKETDPATPAGLRLRPHRSGPRRRTSTSTPIGRARRPRPDLHPQGRPARHQDGHRDRPGGLEADRPHLHRRRRLLGDHRERRNATLDIEAGENVTCTFENTQDATLTIVKETDPATARRPSTSTSPGRASPADLDLDTDAGERDALAADLHPQRLPARRQDGDRDRGRRLGSDRPHLHRRRRLLGDHLSDRKATLDIEAGENVDLHVQEHQARLADRGQGDRSGH